VSDTTGDAMKIEKLVSKLFAVFKQQVINNRQLSYQFYVSAIKTSASFD